MVKKLHHVEETIDKNTGEVSVIKKTFSVKTNNTEEFYITFLSGINALCGLSRNSDIKVLAMLCSIAEYNTGRVKVTSKTRKDIMDKLSMKSSQAFSNSINRLKKGSLINGERGEYEINPEYFWKGTTDERNKLLKEKKIDLLIKFRSNDADV